jgi:hypothetical protein
MKVNIMDRILNKVISNKHLIYIIQEYSRKEYTFLKELIEKTRILSSGVEMFTECPEIYHEKYVKIKYVCNSWMLYGIF